MQIDLNPNLKYLLACSYGPDSMVLFTLLQEKGFYFEVAHVNYMMRGEESEAETKALISYCQKQNIICHVKYVDGKTLKGNFQEEARLVRYLYFYELIKERELGALLTAHQNDDHLETYLMQKESERAAFYYGIKSPSIFKDIRIYRPLLPYSKEDIMNFAKEKSVPYSIDSSNLKTKYTRNQIRQNVLKSLEYWAKRDLNKEIEWLNKQAEVEHAHLEEFVKNNTITISEFRNFNEKNQKQLIYLLFYNSGIVTTFSGHKAENVIKLINSKTESNLQRISGDIYLVKYEGKISFINIKDYQAYSYTLNSPNTLITPQFRAEFEDREAKPFINIDQYPLTVTTFSGEDTYQIKDYEKKVSRLFIDMKLPRHYRLIWPLVKNKDGKVIFVPRYRSEFTPKLHDLFTIFIK